MELCFGAEGGSQSGRAMSVSLRLRLGFLIWDKQQKGSGAQEPVHNQITVGSQKGPGPLTD